MNYNYTSTFVAQQISHESKGEGKQRRIVLAKKSKQEDQPTKANMGAVAKSTAASAATSCSTCLKQVPRDNMSLHKLRCSKPLVLPDQQQQKGGKSKKKQQAKKAEEDVDALIQSFTQTDKVILFELLKEKSERELEA